MREQSDHKRAALGFLAVIVWTVIILTVSVGLVYVLISGIDSGSKMKIAMAVGLIVAPMFAYAAVRRPMVIPFCLFVILVPWDELLALSNGFGTVTKLLAAISGGAVLLWLIRKKVVMRPGRALYWWLAAFGWMVSTIFWALDQNLALGRLATISELFILLVVVALVPIQVQELRTVVVAAALGGLVAAAYGAYFFYHNLATIMIRLALSNGQNAIDPNHFAASLILPITVVTVLALSVRQPLAKLGLIAADLVLFLGLYESGSRGGFLAVAAVFFYLLLASRNRGQIVFVGAIAFGASLLAPTSIWSRFQKAFSSGGAGRIDIWHVGVAAIKQHWLFGAGLDNFPIAYNRAYLQAFQESAQGWSRAPHNLLISTTVELGLVGLVLLLAAWASQFMMLNAIKKDNPLYDYRLIAQGSLVGLFVAAMFLDVMYTKYTWLTFMVGAMTYAAWRQHVHRPDVSFVSVLPEVRPQAFSHETKV